MVNNPIRKWKLNFGSPQLAWISLGFLFTFSHASATNYFSWGVETLRPSFGVNGQAKYDVEWFGNSQMDCVVAHLGKCSMKVRAIGNDGGNDSEGADLVAGPPSYPWGMVGSPSIYYRWWMRIEPGFSWGAGTAKTKASRVLGSASDARGYTAYLMSYGFLIGECEAVAGYTGGGCLLADGSNNTDSNLYIPYDFTKRADGKWHEYIVKIKGNTAANCTIKVNCDAQFEAWVDGTSVGKYNNFKLHAVDSTSMFESWGGWMVRSYFQLNGTSSDGGTMYIDDISTDDQWNSIYSGSSHILAAPTNLRIKG